MAKNFGIIEKYDQKVLRKAVELAQSKEIYDPDHPLNKGFRFWGYHAIFANDVRNPNLVVGVA